MFDPLDVNVLPPVKELLAAPPEVNGLPPVPVSPCPPEPLDDKLLPPVRACASTVPATKGFPPTPVLDPLLEDKFPPCISAEPPKENILSEAFPLALETENGFGEPEELLFPVPLEDRVLPPVSDPGPLEPGFAHIHCTHPSAPIDRQL